MRKFFTILCAALMSVSMFALTPLSGDEWDDATKTLTVNSNTSDNAYASQTEIKHLIVSDAVTELGWGTFFFDSLMTTVELGKNLERIGISAFNECRSLSTITVPASVTYIGVRAFRYCTSLTTFICEAVAPPTIGNAIFENANNLTAIYVPAASVGAYKTAWSAYASIIEAIPAPAGFETVEIDFRSNPCNIISGTATLVSGQFNDGTHGYYSAVVSTELEAGNYKITVGNCQHSNQPGSVKNADGSATLDLIDENGQTISSFTTPKNCYADDDKVTTVWFVADADQTIRIVCPQYTPYLKVEQVESVPEAVTVYAVTFANDAEATGIVPAAIENIVPNTNITLPKNFTMYKAGATLTAWTDGNNNYGPNTGYTVTDNAAMTAVYSANTVTLDDRTDAVTIKWLFSQNDGVPAINAQGSTTFVVAQAEVGGQTIDVQLPIDATTGKFVNSSNSWTQINPGVIFTIPSAKDAVITYKQYDAGAVTTPEIHVTAEGATYDLVAAGTSGQLYYEYIQVTLPKPAATGIENADAAGKAVKFFRDGQLLIEKNGVIYNAQGAVVK